MNKINSPKEFTDNAYIKSMREYNNLYHQSIRSPENFWDKIAEESFFFKKWNKVKEGNFPETKWFIGGKTNLSYNCLDYQITQGRGDKTAILWESEAVDKNNQPLQIRKITYGELLEEVCKFANGLRKIGVKKGDIVTLYMPMIPELVIAVLGCARIGAPHSVIFAGFSANAIADRIEDAKSNYVITSDGGFRREKIIPLKKIVDEACKITNHVKNVIVFKHVHNKIIMIKDRDIDWNDLIADCSSNCEAQKLDSEHMLFLLYTSGSTGKPKGIIHTTGGYMIYSKYTSKMVFNLVPNDIYWCTADIGWITGHSYIIYGPLQNGVTTLMYEGAPNHPNWERFWAICERHKVTKFYTAPTAIRAFMKEGNKLPAKYNLSSLQVLGTVGEPINPTAWEWYKEYIGHNNCPIVDTWWQTETGGIMISPLPGATPTKPGSATLPLLGIEPKVVDINGKELPYNSNGLLCIKQPWPGMLRGIYGDRKRFIDQYFSTIKNAYFTGDGAIQDSDGYFWITGRVDDVVNVSGHRLGTAELESALVLHLDVAEAAVVGYPDEISGQALCAFVVLNSGIKINQILKNELKKQVAEQVGAFARPKQICFVETLPKTRSGKIMRRLLQELATTGSITGDTTTLEDLATITKLAKK